MSDWNDPMPRPKRTKWPEPPELTAWAVEQRAKAAEQAAIDAQPCARCGKPRKHIDHLYVASRLTARCRFQETP